MKAHLKGIFLYMWYIAFKHLPITLKGCKSFVRTESRDDFWADVLRENDVSVVLEAKLLNILDNTRHSFPGGHFCSEDSNPIFLVCGIYMLGTYTTRQN